MSNVKLRPLLLSFFSSTEYLDKNSLGITYGELRLDSDWDSIRADPRFDKLLAELAPRD
jgi:hypothetical protein